MRFSVSALYRRSLLPLLLLCLLVGSLCSNVSIPAARASGVQHTKRLTRIFRNGHYTKWLQPYSAPVDADCRAKLGEPCYSPSEMSNAYGLTPILAAGYKGTGQTIVIVDSFGSPTAWQDLQTFDRDYNLPDPPSFQVLAPLGSVPFDANNTDQVGWAEETSLDVQWAHAMAPGASIVLLTSPVSETEGLQGMPQFLQLEVYALSHHLGNILSQSWGTTENTLFTPAGEQIMTNFNSLYQTAALMGVSVFASTGDTGVVNPDANGGSYAFPTVGFPASSPWVTAVGGTSLYASTNGSYQYETAWNKGVGSASGGGISQYFHMPDYQQANLSASAQTLLHGFRGVPDVAYDADPATSVPVYLSFLPGTQAGYYLFGGTSEGSPQWAGIIADADQLAGHPLGFLNEKLYAIGRNSSGNGGTQPFHDIVVGNNTQGAVQGYSAGIGWDAVTGWGTPDALYLIKSLI